VIIKESSVKNQQSSSGIPSEQLVEGWPLQGRLRRDGAVVQFWDIRRTVTMWEREAEESPLLEAVARETAVEDTSG
jgi:hypothetical protein